MNFTVNGYCLGLIYAFASISFASVGPLAVEQKPPGPPMSEGELRLKLQQTCDEVNRFAKTDRFPVTVSSAEPDSFKLETDNYYNEKIAHLDASDGSGVTAWMLASSGRYIWFHNSAVDHVRYNTLKFETPPPAKWSEAHAIEVATKFADIFAKSWGKNLGKPVARFTWPYTDMDQGSHKLVTYEGSWEIEWRQLSSTGIPYDVGGITVSLSETFGPYDLKTEIGTADLSAEKISPVDKRVALDVAQKELDATLAKGLKDGTLPGVRLLPGKPAISLIIVQPFACFHPPVLNSDATFLKQTQARVAYQVTYQVATSLQGFSGGLSVYVDAKDGSVLCCAFPPVYL